MIRLILLFIWLGWREGINRLKFARRTDQAEQLSRILAVAVPAFLGLFMLAGMIGIGVLAWSAGVSLASGTERADALYFTVELFVLVGLGTMIILIPIGASEQGGAASSQRFILLPIARGRLHIIEILSGAGNIWILILLAGCACLAGGVLSTGRTAAGLAALAAGGLLVFLAMAWGGLLTFFTQWLFRDRGRGELIVLVVMGLLLLFSALGPLLEHVELGPGGEETSAARGPELWISTDNLASPAWMVALPPGLYVASLSAALDGRPAAALAAAGGLLLQGWLLLAVSGRIHAATLDRPSGGRRRKVSGRSYEIPVLPRISPGAAAVAQVQVRTALRTVRGKLAVLFAGGFIIVQAAVLKGVPDAGFIERFLLDDGAALAVTASLLALLSLNPFMFNQFASDGDGLAFQYLAPVTDRDLLMGKAVGMGLLLALAMAPCLLATLALAPGTAVVGWLSVPLAVLSIYALMAPLAAFMSMVFPRSADLSKIGSAGNAHGAANLTGILGLVAAAAPPMLINGFIGTVLGSPATALALMAGWAVLCVALSVPLLTGAARLASERRENLYLVAGGK